MLVGTLLKMAKLDADAITFDMEKSLSVHSWKPR